MYSLGPKGLPSLRNRHGRQGERAGERRNIQLPEPVPFAWTFRKEDNTRGGVFMSENLPL